MPKLCGVAVTMLGFLAVGCVAQREQQTVVLPAYSYLRDGGRFAANSAPVIAGDSLEELAAPLPLDEDALLAPPLPRSELVRMNLRAIAE